MVEAREEDALGAAVRRRIEPQVHAPHPLDRAHVHRTRHGEVAIEGAGRALEYVDFLNRLGEQQVPVVVALGVPVHRFVVRHAVDP